MENKIVSLLTTNDIKKVAESIHIDLTEDELYYIESSINIDYYPKILELVLLIEGNRTKGVSHDTI